MAFPTRKNYRRITASDNPGTLPNRLTFPVGTYTQVPSSNPSTAAAGALGTGYANMPVRTGYNINTPNGRYLIANQNTLETQAPGTGSFLSAGGTQALGIKPNIPVYKPEPQQYYTGQNPYYNPQQTQTGGVQPFRTSQRTVQSKTPAIYSNSVANSQIPSSFSPSDVSYWQSQGYDVGELVNAGLLSYNASNGNYVITQAGMDANAGVNAQQQQLQPGQYVNAQGGVSQGTTPFGTNAAGQRLDVGGNVWDPKTATRDIYGGQFRQAGETRFVRNAKGRLVRQVLRQGGGWDTIRNNRRRGGGNRNMTSDVANAFLNVQVG